MNPEVFGKESVFGAVPIDTRRSVERKSASHGEAGYKRRDRDAYFTEPWVTRALLQAVEFRLWGINLWDINTCNQTVWEPAVGDGRMAEVLSAAGYVIVGSDIRHYGWPGTQLIDFIRDPVPDALRPAAVITNPPFDMAQAFIQRALYITYGTRGKVAILQRHEFDAPRTNHPLFSPPFSAKLVLHKRPRWADGPDKASPRFPYAWYIWDWKHKGPPTLRYLPDPDETRQRPMSIDLPYQGTVA